MKTELEKRIIVAEACGLKGPWTESMLVPFEYWNEEGQLLPFCATIDSIREAVMQQSEEFQGEFAWKLECDCVDDSCAALIQKHIPQYNGVVRVDAKVLYAHTKTERHFDSCECGICKPFVETVEAMK